ncbi:restriction endonuclease subunit S [Reyranella sp.]|uniref:restriction endonuclease subunit S n=1 Tax=Reyranella sp. TaxID=1929291 RepID=UPI0040360967
MNAERLLAHYEKIAEAPDAIARLRRFILDLAVRGKLVSQDSRDEPAPESLKRVSATSLLSRSGKKHSATASELPFALPPGWSAASIAQVLDELQTGPFGSSLHQSDYQVGGTPVINPASIQNERIVPIEKMAVGTDTLLRLATFKLRANDIVMGRRGEMGRCAVVSEHEQGWLCGTGSLILRPSRCIFARFLVLLIGSPFSREYLNGTAVGSTMQNLNQSILLSLAFGLPPFAEQHRIVAKVDELMALCDQLEKSRTAREETRDRLTAASLARLNDPAPETFQTDARFALDALPSMTAQPDQIKQLRQAILSLAVRGRLVPQDPTDEPTSELLKRIAKKKAERKSLTSDPRIRIAPDPARAEFPMTLPPGWSLQSFENLFLFIDYRGNTPPKTDGGIPLITAKNIRRGYLNREPREYISLATFKTWMTRGFPEVGDLFFTTEAPLANICLNDIEEPFALAQRAICFQPYGKINTRLLMLFLMSDVMQHLIDSHATGMTARGIKAAKLKPLAIPIPPVHEQQRIVTRVDMLMSLCDRLEASLAAEETARSRLLDALLHEALEPSDDRLEAAA